MMLKRLLPLLLCWFALLVAVVVEAAPRTSPTPFKFQPLGVANPCFVDSVRFADTYLGGHKASATRWVRVVSWGALDENLSWGQGHAVAVFQWRGGLFVFDVNYGVRKLDVPVAQREDLHAVTAAVYSLYPKVNPVRPAALDDSWPTRKPGFRGADDGPVSPAYRDAYRVAKTLAKEREVRLVRFSYLENGQRRESAATVFLYSQQLCLYVPERGTTMVRQLIPTIDDDQMIRRQLWRSLGFGTVAEVRLTPFESAVDASASPAKKPAAQSKRKAAPTISPAPRGLPE